MNDIIEDNMGLVCSIVKRFKPKSVLDRDEFIQAGRIGLWKASKRYEPAKGKFSTFAWPYIQWEIVRTIQLSQKFKYVEIVEHPSYTQPDNILHLLPSTLTDTERQVILLRLEGYSFEDIGSFSGGKHRGWASKVFNSASSKIIHANRNKKEENTLSKRI